ncbi:Tfp pilus assembly protein FimT/FimU [Candidatus Neomarinimicrobiota bacterium]
MMIKNYYKKGNNRGVTLIEVVVVLFIIGIFVAAVLPKFRNTLDNANLMSAAGKLKDDLHYIHNFAVTHHRSTWFTVDINSNSYSYGIYSTPPNSDPVELTDPATGQPAIIHLDDYNSIITSETLGGGFDYSWWGTPSNSGQIVLNGTKTIVIEAESGYIYEL